MGDVSALRLNDVVVCAIECLDKNGNPSTFREEPDMYLTDVNNKSGTYSTKHLVDPGEYRIWVSATIYETDFGRGFLRTVEDGYVLDPDFADGDVFTVEEYTDLDLNEVNLLLKGDPYTRAYVDGRSTSFGPNLSLDIIGKTVAPDTVLLVKSYGCGELQQTVKIRGKSGNFRYGWNDPHADKHYGKEMLISIIAKFYDGKQRTLVEKLDYDVSHYGWTMPVDRSYAHTLLHS